MTQPVAGRWADLMPRVLSAIAMCAIGGFELWLGGRYFHAFVGFIVGLMVWELVIMLAPDRRRTAICAGTVSGILMAAVFEFSTGALLPIALGLCVVLALAIGLSVGERRRLGIAYSLVILLGGLTLMLTRDQLGFGWIMWLVAVVIASDVAGYFAGKMLGGPKFWPAISPKKTWSGTVAGWVGAAFVGLVFGLGSGMQMVLIGLSLGLAFAAQMGDISESAIKRRCGVKDSSNLIPGHGGVLDRFDGLIGASVAFLAFAALTGLPVGLL
ncbi:MAG: phosphatidate cytidylyltransferase [Paracoccaceae bacterium]